MTADEKSRTDEQPENTENTESPEDTAITEVTEDADVKDTGVEDADVTDADVTDAAAQDTEVEDTEVEDTEPATGELTNEADAPAPAKGKSNSIRLLVIALAVLLVASAAVTAWLYFTKYRPAQLTGETAQAQVLEDAKTGTLAALTYSPDSLDEDLTTAKSHLTGDFLSYYTTFTDDVVRKAVDEKKVATTAEIVRAAVSEMNPDTAKVLLFVNQTTTSADRPDPSMAASSVLVTMTKVDGDWLISAFDPV